jgi:hypothetical protein
MERRKMKTVQMRTISKKSREIFLGRLIHWSFILFLLTILFVACGSIQLSSIWRDREVTIDGKHDDWLNGLLYFERENISLGLLNDESFMYICMIVENPIIRNQIMRQGFTLWFDPSGGNKRIFGIKFPVGMSEEEMQMRGMRAGDVPVKPRREEMDPERIRQSMMRQMTEMEILGPGKDEGVRMPTEEAKGINVTINSSSGTLVYELKIPLGLDEQSPYAIGARAGSLVGIRLEIPKFRRPNTGRGMAGGMPGVGGRGGMGRMPGGGMRGGGMRPQMPGALKIKAVVQLASADKLEQN